MVLFVVSTTPNTAQHHYSTKGCSKLRKISVLLVCRLWLYRLSGRKIAGAFPLKHVTGETSCT